MVSVPPALTGCPWPHLWPLYWLGSNYTELTLSWVKLQLEQLWIHLRPFCREHREPAHGRTWLITDDFSTNSNDLLSDHQCHTGIFCCVTRLSPVWWGNCSNLIAGGDEDEKWAKATNSIEEGTVWALWKGHQPSLPAVKLFLADSLEKTRNLLVLVALLPCKADVAVVPSVDNTALGQLGARTAVLLRWKRFCSLRSCLCCSYLTCIQFCVYCTPGPSHKILCTMWSFCLGVFGRWNMY